MKRLIPSPSMAVAILALIVAMSGSAYAAAKINGKNIKTGTVTSKQIKNGTIVKSDLSKKLSVQGPKGDTGAPGAPGATKVNKHVWHSSSVANGSYEDRDIQCAAGETLVGGGGGWLETTGGKEIAGTLSFSGAVDSSGDPASTSAATGWGAAGHNTSGAAKDFEVYALCATP